MTCTASGVGRLRASLPVPCDVGEWYSRSRETVQFGDGALGASAPIPKHVRCEIRCCAEEADSRQRQARRPGGDPEQEVLYHPEEAAVVLTYVEVAA